MSKISNFFKSVFGSKPNQNLVEVKTTIEEPEYKTRTLNDVKNQIMKPLSSDFKKTKKDFVRKHLIDKGSIDSWTAIQLYGATRLSAIIFNLRRSGMDITSVPCSALDRNSNVCNYTTYTFKSN